MKILSVLCALASLFTGAAFAQTQGTVTITYQAVASPTPAPTTIVLIGIGLLFLAVTYWKTRKYPAGRTMASILFAGGVALVGVSKMYAPIPQESMTGASPLVFSVLADAQVINNTGVAETITQISVDNAHFLATPASTPQCQASMTLTVGGSCFVSVGQLLTAQLATDAAKTHL